MGFLLFLIIVFSLGYLFGKENNNESDVENQLVKRNIEWAEFIKDYLRDAKNSTEKNLLKKILLDIKSSGIPINIEEDNVSSEEVNTKNVQLKSHEKNQLATSIQPQKQIKSQEIDGPSLLLYFGAFLFIAAAGLFVGIGDVIGELKVLAVIFVSLSMYGLGLWLFNNQKKFKQVGITFAGIGLAIAPLIGLAIFRYVFNEDNGHLVWFLTSFYCLAMYGHALIALKSPMLNYIFILTFVSLFQSSIAVLELPIYYFGWGFAAIGLITQLVAKYSNFEPEFRESSRVSSMLLIPLSIGVSIFTVNSEGVLQLAITLLISAFYYAIQSLIEDEDQTKASYFSVSQVALIFGIVTLIFGLTDDYESALVGLVTFNILQLFGYLILKTKNNYLVQNTGFVTLASAITATIITFKFPELMLASSVLLLPVGLAVWWRLKDELAYSIAMLTPAIVTAVYGFVYTLSSVDLKLLSILFAFSVAIQSLIYATTQKNIDNNTKQVAVSTIIIGSFIAIVCSIYYSELMTLGVSIYLIVLFLSLSAIYKLNELRNITALIILAPLVKSIFSDFQFSLADFLIALLYNIVMAIEYRNEYFRWSGSIVWILFPVALAGYLDIDTSNYAWFSLAYIFVSVGFVIARAVARGVIASSSKVILEAFESNKSFSYVLGYTLSVIVALMLALNSNESQILTTVTLSYIALLLTLLALKIEKNLLLLVGLPIVLQLLLFNIIRPIDNESNIGIYLTIAIGIGYLSFFIADQLKLQKINSEVIEDIKVTSLFTMYCLLIIPLISELTVMSPIALMFTGLLTLYYSFSKDQNSKETSGLVIVASLMWLAYFYGIREIQFYTHTLALTFGLYAYWRNYIKDKEGSDNYIVAMLATATIPLLVQALSGQNGDFYGWMLILEQVFFIILGTVIQNKFVTFWGLYVAVGSILFQMRDLGWVALLGLAIFIISIAIYRINSDNKQIK